MRDVYKYQASSVHGDQRQRRGEVLSSVAEAQTPEFLNNIAGSCILLEG